MCDVDVIGVWTDRTSGGVKLLGETRRLLAGKLGRGVSASLFVLIPRVVMDVAGLKLPLSASQSYIACIKLRSGEKQEVSTCSHESVMSIPHEQRELTCFKSSV